MTKVGQPVALRTSASSVLTVINKMKAWLGSVAISKLRGIVSPANFVYTALHAENPRFLHNLFRLLRYMTGYLSISKGIRINQWDLEPEQHSRMPVLLPPRAEQDIIAAFLDRETAKIDALVAEREPHRLAEGEAPGRHLPRRHQGPEPGVPMKDSGIEWLGQVPAHWKACD